MTPDEWKARAIAHLELLDDFWRDEGGGNHISEMATRRLRFGNAKPSFPGLTWDEFNQMTDDRQRKVKLGRPPGTVMRKFWMAAEDARSLKELWKALRPGKRYPEYPLHPHDIVAERYGIPRQQVDEYGSRATSRWPGKHRP